jgi:hypothetical protein
VSINDQINDDDDADHLVTNKILTELIECDEVKDSIEHFHYNQNKSTIIEPDTIIGLVGDFEVVIREDN